MNNKKIIEYYRNNLNKEKIVDIMKVTSRAVV